jgi:Cu(I)/Ag(I) efflux system membrane protein CusA/SilA
MNGRNTNSIRNDVVGRLLEVGETEFMVRGLGYIKSVSSLKRILVGTPTDAQIPITQVADIEIKKGPPGIKSENARKTAWLNVDIKNIDVGTYVANAQKAVDEQIKLPTGYSLGWSGQYEYMQRAKARLKFIIPITLVIIFVLLFMNFKNIPESVIVMLSLPFAHLSRPRV